MKSTQIISNEEILKYPDFSWSTKIALIPDMKSNITISNPSNKLPLHIQQLLVKDNKDIVKDHLWETGQQRYIWRSGFIIQNTVTYWIQGNQNSCTFFVWFSCQNRRKCIQMVLSSAKKIQFSLLPRQHITYRKFRIMIESMLQYPNNLHSFRFKMYLRFSDFELMFLHVFRRQRIQAHTQVEF